jgi:arylsulfatase A-like enzyme
MHGSHGMRYKGKPQEESLGIPLIARGPGVARDRQVDTLAGIVDMPSTFLSLCGVPVPGRMVGRDLSPALAGDELEVDCVYCEGRLNIRDPAEFTERDAVSGYP